MQELISQLSGSNRLIIIDEADRLSLHPATTSRTDNLTLRATLEPIKDFKIDLSATRTKTTQKSIHGLGR